MIPQILRALFFSVVLISSLSAHPVDSDRIATTLETLRQSVNAHDYTQLEPSLADNFTYQGSNAGMSQMIMRQVIAC